MECALDEQNIIRTVLDEQDWVAAIHESTVILAMNLAIYIGVRSPTEGFEKDRMAESLLSFTPPFQTTSQWLIPFCRRQSGYNTQALGPVAVGECPIKSSGEGSI